ncbi:MAG: OsmC family peroxiredoxin [Acidobacteria bacterium ACB1]|nr:Peroxiredoxin OsmC [Pyrinomonadaceae bacterium]MCE7963111.1 OsmC family peroxiredoxin [Acidobacteria bacterium ACB1]RIJ96555.1 MAG: peroxiredoxin [Acidobacteriota bacterium]
MNIKRTSEAKWNGSVTEGSGEVKLGSGAFAGPYSFNSRFGNDTKSTNPEELIAAAHAGCFSMAFSLILGKSGFTPKSIETKASVHIEKQGEGFAIPKIELVTVAEVPGITDEEFQTIATTAKENCPVSKVLSAAEITLDATLKPTGAAA